MNQRSIRLLLAGFVLIAATVLLFKWRHQNNVPVKEDTRNLLDFENELQGSIQVAQWIFDNHECRSCHTLSKGGFMGLTAHGKEVGRDFQGCPGMLQTVSETIRIPEASWNEHQRKVRQDFVRFGCTTCHHVGETQITLTAVGSKAAVLHMSCSGVMNALHTSGK